MNNSVINIFSSINNTYNNELLPSNPSIRDVTESNTDKNSNNIEENINNNTKEKIKYEKQLHEEIIKVNNIIYNKKILKKEKEARLEQLFNEKCELKKEYNKDLSNNQNMYWNQYTENEKIYNSLIPIRAQSHDTFDPNFNFSRNRKTEYTTYSPIYIYICINYLDI